jgi:hypothetical protein
VAIGSSRWVGEHFFLLGSHRRRPPPVGHGRAARTVEKMIGHVMSILFWKLIDERLEVRMPPVSRASILIP